MSLAVLPPVAEKIKQQIWSKLGLSERSIHEAVQSIKDWLQLQPHLPNDFNDNRIERWLVRCGNSIEKTKTSLDIYYTAKTILPEIMADWETESEWFRNAISSTYIVPMPDLTEDFYRICLVGFRVKDASDFVYADFLKVFFMILDIRMNEDYSTSEILVLDLANCSTDHIPKITYPTVRKGVVTYLKGYGANFKEIHFINAPSYGYYLVNLLKACVGAELESKIYAHGTDLTTLYPYISKKYLTTDLAGEGNSIIERWVRWTKHLESHQTFFKDRENLKSDESKRSNAKFNSDELFGTDGSFRHLDVE